MFALAITAYQAYGESVGWKNHLGKAMPRWDDLPSEIREAWRVAADAVAEVILQRWD
jgi:hypothetical protein